MRLSVVILAHNQLALTRACLQALAVALDGIDHEVICVDNASEEDLTTLIDEAPRFRRFQIVPNRTNETFSIANNRAALLSSGDWLLFLNNDVAVEPASLETLLAFVGRTPAAGACGGRLEYPRIGRLQHAGMEQMLWGIVSNYGVGASTSDERFTHNRQPFAVTGAMLAVRREAFDAAGGFEPIYRWGYEDVDLCLKTRAAGWQVWYVAGARATHAESATLRSRRRSEDVDRNYVAYRQRWDSILAPAESAYLRWMTHSGIRRVAVFGTGAAGRALGGVLRRNGIAVSAFAATVPDTGELDGSPVVGLGELCRFSYDRLVVGSQYYFELERELAPCDPTGVPLLPVLKWTL
jgi:GT2 family glycosyltransferase